jgi:ATP-dependent DNA helicase RecQ
MTTGTVFGHLAEAVEQGEPVDLQQFFTVAELAEVAAAFGRHGFGALGPVFESLGGKMDYGRLRLFRASANRRRS